MFVAPWPAGSSSSIRHPVAPLLAFSFHILHLCCRALAAVEISITCWHIFIAVEGSACLFKQNMNKFRTTFPSQSCHNTCQRNLSSRVWLLRVQLRFWLVMAQIPSHPHPPLLNGSSSVGSSLEDSRSCCGLVLFYVFWLTAYKVWWRRSPTMIM